MQTTNDKPGININISAPPEVVFDAWIKPELLQKWLFVGPTSELTEVEVNAVPQGRFSMIEREKTIDEQALYAGSYLVLDRPSKLEFTFSAPKHFEGETTVKLAIGPTETGSELNLTQTGMQGTLPESSWKNMLNQLKLTLENQ